VSPEETDYTITALGASWCWWFKLEHYLLAVQVAILCFLALLHLLVAEAAQEVQERPQMV
jgi:hypothetical protein